MFFKGSRYRNLPQSPHLRANGDSTLGVDLRLIPDTPGQFLHGVAERDRLDLLAFKYYSDSKRWWLIADANRHVDYPVELLDARPFVREELALTRPDLFARAEPLLGRLRALGPAEFGRLGPNAVPTIDVFSGLVVIVQYAAASTRAAVLEEVRRAGFRLTASAPWSVGSDTAEALSLDDPRLTLAWNGLLALLNGLSGVRRAHSVSAGQRLQVSYNTALLSRASLISQIERAGFAVLPEESRTFDPVGRQIVIPPNQAV